MPKRWVNGVELGRELGVGKGRVSQLFRDGIFRRGLNNKYDLEECKKNYLDTKKNAPRLDPGDPLPLDDTVASFKKDAAALKEISAGENESSSHLITLRKSQAVQASIKAKKEMLLLQVLEGKLVDKNIIYAAVRDLTMKNNASIKAKIISIPKRIALGWPNPKERALIETMINEIITSILTEMSEIDIAELEEE